MSIAPYDIHHMAQSAVSNQENCKMVTKEHIKSATPDDVCEWEASKVEASLKALKVTIGKDWSNARKYMN